ncbi:hypothetical protein PORY_000147 [Pneumocystis oryctolagi]|uniref:Uncharacterized protein n=1 Tax=Pneumocystis oryctolagi TaxID=42067 RepID=A0ACB7CEG9_9ASCO|nr:hypothetical protein PORY_000147 [Pneumocystis oryctolagi]
MLLFDYFTRFKNWNGIRNISTQSAEILSIAKLTRRAEEAKHSNVTEASTLEMPVLNLSEKSHLLMRLKRKNTDTQAKPLKSDDLSYKGEKSFYNIKNLSLRKSSMKSLVKENTKNIFSKLQTEETGKRQMTEIQRKNVKHEDNIHIENPIHWIPKKQSKIKSRKKINQNEFDTNSYKIENIRKKNPRFIVKNYVRQMPVSWKPHSVSQNDLKPYIPTWIAPLNNITYTLEPEKQISANNESHNKKENFNYCSTSNVNDLVFYANRYIYKNSSIELAQKTEMLNKINEIIMREKPTCT